MRRAWPAAGACRGRRPVAAEWGPAWWIATRPFCVKAAQVRALTAVVGGGGRVLHLHGGWSHRASGPVRAAQRADHPSGQAAVPRRRDHEGRPCVLLPRRRAGDAPARARPADHAPPLQPGHRGRGLHAEGDPGRGAPLGAPRARPQGGRHGLPRARGRRPRARVAGQPELHHAPRVDQPRRSPRRARPPRLRSRSRRRRRLASGQAHGLGAGPDPARGRLSAPSPTSSSSAGRRT
jgi:hypothetical protein